MSEMERFFHPKSIAVIGASANPESIGNDVLKNILYSKPGKDRSFGFQGEVYPISLKYDEVLGLKTFRNILDVPGPIDLAICIVPGKVIPQIFEECGKKGCKNAIVISAGFAEHGEEGKKREKEISRIAKEQSIRFIGPNCLGIFSPYESLNASFAPDMPLKGPASLISQSGALCTSIIAYAEEEHIGFSNFVSIGNKADIDDSDMIKYFDEDPNTKCIAIYMESLKDGRRFYEIAKGVVENTPMVILKVGKTEAGRKAASSHTGALAGADWAYEAAFRQAGVRRVDSMYELFDAIRALSYQPLPNGENIAIITNSGGPGVIASDTANEIGLTLVNLSSETMKKLDEVCPPAWSHGNPVDIIGDADTERYIKSLEILLNAPEVDGIIFIMAPTAVVDPLMIAKRVAEIAKNTTKPILASFVGIIGEESEDYLESSGVPTIEFPERVVKAMYALVHRKRIMDRLTKLKSSTYTTEIESKQEPIENVQNIFEKVRTDGRKLLTLNEAREIFELFEIPINKSYLVTSAAEAAEKGAEVGFPLAMKISSQDVVHKTEVGGVVLEVGSPEEARRAYERIINNVKSHVPDARIEGVVMDAMVRGPEVIIGVSSDPQFGPMVMFGLGGVLVEIYKDVSFRLIPLTKIDALEMIEEIRGKAAYFGARGMPKVDRNELAELIVKVAEAVRAHPDIAELDINPLLVTKDGLVAVDARILITE